MATVRKEKLKTERLEKVQYDKLKKLDSQQVENVKVASDIDAFELEEHKLIMNLK